VKSRNVWRVAAHIGVVVLAVSLGALAQTPTQVKFSGLINDFSPATVAPVGPWEVRGEWSLKLNGDSGTADFSATLTMVRSDLWVILNSADPNAPAARSAHTHHITLADGTVTPLANGFRVSGTGTVTASGNPAPFGESSPLQIDITGGNSVAFSNIKLTLGAPAAGHFGSQALNGVVRSSK
jgi:hypothetical protein